MKDIRIMDGTINDKESIFAFFSEVLSHTFRDNDIWDMQDDLKEEIEEKEAFFMESVLEPQKSRRFLLAKLDGDIVGCIAIGPANDSIIEGSKGRCAGWLEVGTVFVHPDHQKKGLADRMIREMEKMLKDQGMSHYVLDSGYPISKKIWTRRYGEPDYVMKDHWGEGADHLIWCVEL